MNSEEYKKKNKKEQSENYKEFLNSILEKIHITRYEMLKSVNKKTVLLYLEIGGYVSKKVMSKGWGKSVVEKLSKDLQIEFPGVRGFSVRNIWNMKSLYEFYKKNKKLQPLVAEINWTQNCLILEKCKDILEIEYYLKKTKQMGWSKLDLKEKIKNNYFENQILTQNNFEKSVSNKLKSIVAWEFLDDYNIDLLNPDLPISEKEIENSIVKNIVNFLSEMGGNFAFIGRQYRIEFEKKEYFIDLLFFNFKLNCYVVFELKAREFNPKDIGQVQFYMQLVNKKIKKQDQNLTIGIIICKEKNRTIVEYMLEKAVDPIGVSTFNKYKDLPEEYAKYLPKEEDIIKRLVNV